jgi:phosphomannomutase
VYRKLQQRLGGGILTVLHTEDDPYFGGQTTEPNEKTLEDALGVLRQKAAPFKVGIRNDPDSDRGLVGDAGGAIKMNRFAPMVMRYLLDLGRNGGLVTTLPTSSLGPDLAKKRGKAVTVTATGFKNFRPHLLTGKALLAYEESDGMTIQGHTLDKDGILAGLAAVRMVLHYGRPLSHLLQELETELGTYYWQQETFMIDMSAKEAHAKLGALAAIRPGRTIEADGKTRTVRTVNTEDGYKFTFDDGTWMMMRPSGTEPKVRTYAETRESLAATKALCEAAKALALEAIHG